MIRSVKEAGIFRERLEAVGASTYVLGQIGDLKCIICLCCGSISYNRNDVENAYCGHCGVAHNARTDPRQDNVWKEWAKVLRGDYEEFDASKAKPPVNTPVLGLLERGAYAVVLWDGSGWDMAYINLQPVPKLDVVRWRRITW